MLRTEVQDDPNYQHPQQRTGRHVEHHRRHQADHPGEECAGQVEREVRQHRDDQAAAGVVVQPGEVDRQGGDQEQVEREGDAHLGLPGQEEERNVPAGPDHPQDQARHQRVEARLQTRQREPAPAGFL